MKQILFLTLFLTSLFSFGGKFIPADKAFGIDAKVEGNNVVVDIKLAKDIHVYEKEFKFIVTKPKNVDITKFAIKPKAHKDGMGMMVYNKDLTIKIPLNKINQKDFSLKVELMGCSDKGLCYPPYSKSFDLKTDSVTKQVKQKEVSEEGKIVDTLRHGSIFSIVAMFFGFGLLLALTPCIFPMIPILSSIIVSSSKDKEISTIRGIWLSLVYILSMSVAYTVAGVLAGLFGSQFNIQAMMQNPFVIVAFALIFVVLAFSMFGYYNIELPQSLQNKLNAKSNEAGNKGGIMGVAIMGFLSALIVGPCVAPALAGALVYISQSGDAFVGGLALFVMSLGMGVPLLVVGAGAGKFMPKPGGWMTKVSQIFGVIMLLIALWMIDRIVEPSVMIYIWAGFFAVMGVIGLVKKAFIIPSIIFILIGGILGYGAVRGATNPLKPFEVSKSSIAFEYVDEKELDRIVKSSKKPVLVDFTAKWCVSCKELEEITFKDKEVVKLMKKFKLLRVDITNNTSEDKKLLDRFSIVGPPAILFFKDGVELKSKKIVGYKEPKVFEQMLREVLE